MWLYLWILWTGRGGFWFSWYGRFVFREPFVLEAGFGDAEEAFCGHFRLESWAEYDDGDWEWG